jgi:hypothetical protein
MRSRSSNLADDGSEHLDSCLPISSRSVETIQKAMHVGIFLVILVNQLQLIHNFLGFLEDLTDPLVISLHAGLGLNEVNIMNHNEFASIKFILGSSRGQADRILETWELVLDMLAHVGKNDP